MIPESTPSMNATYLTKKFSGRENELWTPLLLDFLKCQAGTSVPVFNCIRGAAKERPYYQKSSQDFKVPAEQKHLYVRIWGESFLEKIGFEPSVPVGGNGERFAGVHFDIVIFADDSVTIIENKPYYGSRFTGPQRAGGDYPKFVRWIEQSQRKSCRYLVTRSSSCSDSAFRELQQAQIELGEATFGLIFYEEIFKKMASEGYRPNAETFPDLDEKTISKFLAEIEPPEKLLKYSSTDGDIR